MPIREWNLSDTSLHRVKQRKYEVAVIPTSAIEPHNLHLPQGQDWFHTRYVAEESCRLAWEKTQSILCLPGIPYGVDANLLDFPFAIHVSQETLDRMLREIIKSLVHHGIYKFLILNGHGGNDFTPFIRQIQGDMNVHVFLCNWWTVGKDKYPEIFENPDDHAGEMETSVALALFPDLIEPGVAGDGKVRPFKFEALRKGYVSTSRRFSRMNDHCGVGDPSQASAEKGKKYLELVITRISQFLIEVAESPLDEYFPHVK